MKAIISNNLITIVDLTVHEAQQLKEALRNLQERERWRMKGERKRSNEAISNAIDQVQIEWAKTQ